MIVFSSREAAWVFVLGMATGGGLGTLLGHWLTLLTLRDPLRQLARAYREVCRDVTRYVPAWLAAIESADARR